MERQTLFYFIPGNLSFLFIYFTLVNGTVFVRVENISAYSANFFLYVLFPGKFVSKRGEMCYHSKMPLEQ